MDRVLEAMLLGLVQGLTEFLPISSSGHLALFQSLLGWENPEANLSFNIAVHVGSLVAVLVFVRREIIAMLTTAPRLILVLVIATLPVVVLALATPAKDFVRDMSNNTMWVGALLIATAGILVTATRVPEGDREAATLPLPRALLVGIAQILALLPGISRSGTTLTAGLAVGLRREQAVRFAFLMAAPAIGGAFILDLLDGSTQPNNISVLAIVSGAAVSFIASLFAMKVMVRVVMKKRLAWFAVYCVALGTIVIVAGLI